MTHSCMHTSRRTTSSSSKYIIHYSLAVLLDSVQILPRPGSNNPRLPSDEVKWRGRG